MLISFTYALAKYFDKTNKVWYTISHLVEFKKFVLFYILYLDYLDQSNGLLWLYFDHNFYIFCIKKARA